jgi:hypothetical protein
LCGDGNDTKSPEEDLHIVCPGITQTEDTITKKMLEDSRLQEVGLIPPCIHGEKRPVGEVILDSDSQNARRVLEVDEPRKIVKQVS